MVNIEPPIEKCPACGRRDFANEFGIDIHLNRYCEESSEKEEAFGRELMSGENHPRNNASMLEELSRASSGENAPWYGVTGEEHPWHGVTGEAHPMYGYEWSEEQLEQLSESHKGHLSSGTEQIHVPETNTTVRSGWEAEVDVLLHDAEIEYEYEGETFDLGDYTYTPDFVCEDSLVIEIKGYVWDGDVEKSEDFMDYNPSLTYIVVGSELPSDHYLGWEARGSLPGLIKQVRD